MKVQVLSGMFQTVQEEKFKVLCTRNRNEKNPQNYTYDIKNI